MQLIFETDNILFTKVSIKLLDEYLKSCKLCKDIDSQLRLKRDILWMAITL